MSRIFLIILKDGLQLPSGLVAGTATQSMIYCRVPEDWVEGDVPESTEMWIKGPMLRADKLEELYRAQYGANWKDGNEDGSRYVVLSTGIRLLNAENEKDAPWTMDDPNSTVLRYFYYVVDEQGRFRLVTREQM